MATRAKAPAAAAGVEKIQITPPNFATYAVVITGTGPLVVERFSKKAELMEKMAQGTQAGSKKVRTARDYEEETEQAKYYAPAEDGHWEGMNAAAFRAGMISACRLVGYKMTIAKLTVFVEADAFDVADGLPIVRIYGPSVVFTAHTRNATGVVDVRARPQYRNWAMRLRIKFDQDQFNVSDVVNLLSRVGAQVGVGAGRPDSKSSAGCGWGTFRVVGGDEEAQVIERFGIAT